MVDERKIPDEYKVTEVGVIPKDWELVKIGGLGDFSKGSGIRKDQANSGRIPCVRYGELYTKHNDIIRNYYSYISRDIADTSKKLKSGDILFAGSGETKEEIGKCAAFIDKVEAYAGGDIIIFSPSKGISEFYGYLLNAPFSIKQKASKGQGDAIVHIGSSNLANIVIPFPPESEQKAIAEALSDTDKLMLSFEKLIDKKKKIKQGAMQQLLMGEKRLPGFSGEWEVRNIQLLGSFISGNGFPIKYQSNDAGKYPFYKVSDFNNIGNDVFMKTANNYIEEDTRKAISAKLIPANAVIFAKIGAAIFLERKRISSVECCIDNNMMSFISNTDLLYPKLAYYLFRNIQLSNLVSATALPSLSAKDIGKLEIRIPYDLEEQKAIAQVLSDMDVEIEALEEKLGKYKAIKQAMMQVLLTGRIRLI